MEDSEDVLTALRREVYEETGCVCDEIKELGIVAENRASLDYPQINYYYVVTTTHAPGESHLTEAEQASCTVVQWHPFGEMVRLIQEQKFDRAQGKYLKARDVAALREYAAWISKAVPLSAKEKGIYMTNETTQKQRIVPDQEKNTELTNLLGLFLKDTACEVEVQTHRSEKEDFRVIIKAKSKRDGSLVIKLAENDFTSSERIWVWERCAKAYRKLGYYCPDFYADKNGEFPTVDFEGHHCVAWAEEFSKYQTAEALGVGRDGYWDDAVLMTAKIASRHFDFAEFPSAYCLFDLFCPSDETDEVTENALLWKAYAKTLPEQFQEQVQRIWKRWLDNQKNLEQMYPLLPASVFQADLNPTNVLLDGEGKFVGILDFNLCGKDVFLNYLFRENYSGSSDEELNAILRSLETAKSVYRFSDREKAAALPLYRCLKPLWITRYDALKDAGNDIRLIQNALDETEYAQTREIDFSSVMDF